jgi:simple sugar transport system permease protein
LLIFVAVLDADPWTVLTSIVENSVGSSRSLGQTLLVTAPLILTALAAAIPFHARVFNIGGEGQVLAGAGAATALLFLLEGLDSRLLTVLAIVAAIVGGASWGLLAGALAVLGRANVVVVTLMLNFVAISLIDYVVTVWRDPIAPQTLPLSPTLVDLPNVPQANIGIIIAALVALGAYILLFATPRGLGIRATGANPDATRLRGYKIARIKIETLVIGGACAGLAGAIELLGNRHALSTDISQGYGYIGIAIALVSGLHPLRLVIVSFAFAAITVGSNSLPATAGVSSATSLVFVSGFVLIALAFGVIDSKVFRTGA